MCVQHSLVLVVDIAAVVGHQDVDTEDVCYQIRMTDGGEGQVGLQQQRD